MDYRMSTSQLSKIIYISAVNTYTVNMFTARSSHMAVRKNFFSQARDTTVIDSRSEYSRT